MQSAKSVGNGKWQNFNTKTKKRKKIQKARAGSKVEQNKMRKKAPDRWVGFACLFWGRRAANLGAVKANTTLAAKKFRAFVFVSVFVRALLLSLYVCTSGYVSVCVCVRGQKFPF